jgi:hypothetical protein
VAGPNLFGVFAGIGTALVIWAGVRVARAWRTREWGEAEGEVISSAWREKVTGEHSTAHELVVTYRYRVGDTLFTSSRVAVGGRDFGKRADADAAVARYRPRARVTVFYDRHHASEAVLERQRIGWFTPVLALAGIATFVLGGLLYPAG